MQNGSQLGTIAILLFFDGFLVQIQHGGEVDVRLGSRYVWASPAETVTRRAPPTAQESGRLQSNVTNGYDDHCRQRRLQNGSILGGVLLCFFSKSATRLLLHSATTETTQVVLLVCQVSVSLQKNQRRLASRGHFLALRIRQHLRLSLGRRAHRGHRGHRRRRSRSSGGGSLGPKAAAAGGRVSWSRVARVVRVARVGPGPLPGSGRASGQGVVRGVGVHGDDGLAPLLGGAGTSRSAFWGFVRRGRRCREASPLGRGHHLNQPGPSRRLGAGLLSNGQPLGAG